MKECPVCFLSNEKWLSGIVHYPIGRIKQRAVLIVVGGPQTRVGSHRQFTLLARKLASQGHFVMRFDYHGMGDSEGVVDSFLNVTVDIYNALQEFEQHCGDSRSICLWGLCDAASAILLFCQSEVDRVEQLILLNPWVTSSDLQAKTMIKQYYFYKLSDRNFWYKVIRLDLNVKDAISGLLSNLYSAMRTPKKSQSQSVSIPDVDNYVGLMKKGLMAFSGKVAFVLSGNDLVAAEFELLLAQDNSWKNVCEQADFIKIGDANHTFSSQSWREQVEDITLYYLD